MFCYKELLSLNNTWRGKLVSLQENEIIAMITDCTASDFTQLHFGNSKARYLSPASVAAAFDVDVDDDDEAEVCYSR